MTLVLEGAPLQVVGQGVARPDYLSRALCAVEFATDFRIPGMLEGAVLRSPFAHAEVLAIDARAALEVPGVVCVLLPEDLADIDPYFGPVYRDQPILAIDRARFEGEPIAAVAATSLERAQEAVGRIDVRYRPLPSAVSAEAARAASGPDIHTSRRRGKHYSHVLAAAEPLPGKNVAAKWRYERGDPESALAQADLIVAGEYRVPMIHHFPLEPIGAVVDFTGGRLRVYSGTQTPFEVRQELAAIFGLPLSDVRVVALPMGGAFGAKAFPKIEPLTAALARKAGRPVRIVLSMEDTARTIRRTGAHVRIRSGVRADGTLMARVLDVDFEIGAYADAGPRVMQKGSYVAAGPYRIPNLRIESRAVYTTTPPSGAYRGFGAPEMTWAYEQHTDEIAERLGMGPLEMRRRNLVRRGETYADGDKAIDTDFAATLDRVWALSGGERPREPLHGKGVAVSFKPSQSPTESSAIVRLHMDASCSVLSGTADMGQGTQGGFAQIVAEEFGIPLARVAVHRPDTALAPFDQTTTSSRSTVSMGNAVQDAARKVREELLRRFAEVRGLPSDRFALRQGVIVGAGEDVALSQALAETAPRFGSEIVEVGHFQVPERTSMIGGPTPFWEPCWAVAEVKVDPETGVVRVVGMWTAVDSGRSINPRQVEAQDLGSTLQGIGSALYEEMVYEDGLLRSPSLVEYRVPLVSDLPDTFMSLAVEHQDGPGPFGAKGIGEGGIMAAAAAIGNAVAQAIGRRVYDLPLSPERVWRALSGAGGCREGEKP